MKKIKKITIVSGDATHNRGDRAILAGHIQILHELFPDAHISAFSWMHERDTRWFGIPIYPADSIHCYSRAIRSADFVLWGGGELLQDDTSRVKIPYWWARISYIHLLNPNIIGAGQGLGPIHHSLSATLTRKIFRMIRLYIARDTYSEPFLRSLGITTPIISSTDPAIFLKSSNKSVNEIAHHESELLNGPFIAISPRKWFHQHSQWIPHEYAVRYKLRQIPGEKEYLLMIDTLAHLADELIEKTSLPIVFFPMYVLKHEGDDVMSSIITKRMKYGDKTTVLRNDYPPTEFMKLLSNARIMIGLRLHATILSTNAGIPSINFSYAPKGKNYFERLGYCTYTLPIADILDKNIATTIIEKSLFLLNNHDSISNDYSRKLYKFRCATLNDYQQIPSYLL